jgi:poly(A) polymerase
MEFPERAKPVCTQADAIAVVRRLRESGHEAYFAGGCVRDMLLGLTPKDYDVATGAPPDVVRKIFPNTQAVGAAFGVILVRLGKSVVEVATFRTDGLYSDGRRPDTVRFTTAAEDAQRRDFTINGLFFDPVEEKTIDFVGGREDLTARRLRAIGDAGNRFEEDHLRLLRAVRFAARFDLSIERETTAAIRRAAPRLKGISPERIAEELRMMLTPVTRRRAWELLIELELSPVIFRMLPPQLSTHTPSPGIPGEGWSGGLFLALCPAETIPFGLALAAASLDVQRKSSDDIRRLFTKPNVQRTVNAMRKSLKISNDESDAMAGTLMGLPLLLTDGQPALAMKKRFLAQPTSGLSRKLLAALSTVGLFRERADLLAGEFADLDKTEFAPPPLVTGDDLIAAGWQAGPVFKRLLDGVYDEQLEGRIVTKEAAMQWCGQEWQRIAESPGRGPGRR